MKCIYCGKEYKMGFKSNSKYCSIECRKNYYLHKNKKTKYCVICGKELSGKQRSYCSAECRMKANLQKQYETNKIEYKKPKSEVKPEPTNPNLSLSELEALARAEGLTAGQYCVKHRLYER